MQARKFLVLSGLCASALGGLMACSSSSPAGISTLPPGSGAGTSDSSAGTSSSAGGNTSTAGTASTSGGSTAIAGGTGSQGGNSSGGVSAAGGSSAAGASGGGASSGRTGMSMGCGKAAPANVKLGAWTNMADPTMAPGNPPPVMITNVGGAAAGTVDKRGYYVYVPKNYDSSKPSRVIYEGAGCGDTNAVVNGGTDGYQYENVDGSDPLQTIQVGLEYDPDRADHCYDDQNPFSNDFEFFPYLYNTMESDFCVDLNQQFFSGYSTGSWLANQLTCAFPDVLRGVVEATGNEPPMQPTCKSGFPVAGLFLHDTTDTYNTYAGILPACTRLLKQNGCTTQECVPSSTTTTTPYTIPTLPNGVPQGMSCVSFNGCPANAPVAFCTTTQNGGNPAHYIGEDNWVLPLFWDFLKKQQ